MIPSADYGQSPPSGVIYTPEQAADLAAGARARAMAAALDAYATCCTLASLPSSDAAAFRADGRAALHMHPELLAILEGDGPQ